MQVKNQLSQSRLARLFLLLSYVVMVTIIVNYCSASEYKITINFL